MVLYFQTNISSPLVPFRTSCGLYENSVWFVGGSSVGGFSAIKMTALAGPQFLVGLTDPDPAVYTFILSHPDLVSCFPVSVEWNFH